MANTIQIKRSLGSVAPASLLEGEMAITFGNNTFYIGAPNNTIRDLTAIFRDALTLGGVAAANYALKTYVDTAINNLVNGAGAAYDTLKELADLIASDQSGIAALTTTVSGKLQKDQNLSDLTSASTARTNLGLGSMATQNANAVAITGGTINNVALDGGTF